MTANQIHRLSDLELLRSTKQAVHAERQSARELLLLLGELDERRLYLGEGCSSLFTYCTQVLHLSEHAAYHRIEVARLSRKFPIILELVASGELTLTNASLLGARLTPENHRSLLAAARHKSKREVEYQVACLSPRPAAKTLVRRLVDTRQTNELPGAMTDTAVAAAGTDAEVAADTPPASRVGAVIAPSAADRYTLKVTITADAHAKLRKAQDLLRHSLPNGDPAAVIERALTLLVEQLERAKTAKVRDPRNRRPPRSRRIPSRYIPADVRRTVWKRDQGQCAFVGSQGRCRETGRLEFHHIVPFADGGPTDVANLSLRCQAHNSYESRRWASPAWRDDDRQAGPAPP
ncbi:MAG TPA: HNH endonuclease signature motif containing protein [Vicinamibacterales bacterium]|nr:HNH endonuclease signature motif containing protein [Vicinamibacterales bacterium]